MVIEDEERRFTLYRLDFKAVILDEYGQRQMVLIELQKSKLPTNILRFRNYLGLAYTQRIKAKHPLTQEEQDCALPIISIYILGYNVDDLPYVAVKIDRRGMDMSRHEEAPIQSEFINQLTHTCYVLQVLRLPEERRSRIEQFLTLFNQAWVMETRYIISLREVPEEFKDIAEYLQRPLQEEATLAKLRAEEEMENYFAQQEAEKAFLQRLLNEARAHEEEERRQKEEERRQKEIAIGEARESKFKLARVLLRMGMSVREVALETGLTEREVQALE